MAATGTSSLRLGVCVYLVFCTFILFYLLSLYCLFFDLRILIMSLISLSFSHYVRILTGNVMPLATNISPTLLSCYHGIIEKRLTYNNNCVSLWLSPIIMSASDWIKYFNMFNVMVSSVLAKANSEV
jgi:hypothetical protein